MSTATVQCENCGKDITRERNSINRSKHHFCDLSCSSEWRRVKKKVIQCDYCGKDIVRDASHFNRSKHHFCDLHCMGDWRRESEEHKEKVQRAYLTKWQKENRGKTTGYCRNWRHKNPEKAREIDRRHNATFKAKETAKKWWANNKDRRIKYDIKRRSSLSYRISDAMSASIREALGREKGNSHWCDLAGYTVSDLKKHLEKQFVDGMTWENYGEWHIDHIIPKSVFNFTKPIHEDFKRCWSLDNLQPLWAKDNISKYNKLDRPFQPTLALEV